MADINNDIEPTNGPSIDEIFQETLSRHSDKIDVAGLGKSTPFAAPSLDRYLSYGTKTFGKLGYDPYVDNSELYNANTHWTQDITRAWIGMQKLSGVGFTDTFGFGVFSSDDSHKNFEKIMDTYGSTREGATGFVSNTLLSAGYTTGIIKAIAAEELILLATTGGMGNIATAGEVGRGVSNIWRAWDKGSKVRKGVAASIKFAKKFENARLLKAPIGFVKQLNPIGETASFIKNFDKMQGLNRWQKAFTGAGSLARDARKIHMTMAESNLEANLARDRVREDMYDEWYSNNVGETMDNATRAELEESADKVFNITYNSNMGLIYATNAITFNTMFRSMRLTNKAFGFSKAGGFTAKGLGSKATVTAVKKNLGSYAQKKMADITWKNATKWAATSSMEGVQEIGQDFISGFAVRYATGDERLRGQTYNSMLGAIGDMRAESFFSGMLMGTFAAPTSFSIKQAQNFFVHGGHKSVTNRAVWKEQRKADYESRVKDAEFLTEFFNKTGSWLDVQGTDVFRQAEAQERMVQAAEDKNRMDFEDNRAETFRLGMKQVIKNGLESEMIEHLEGLKEHNPAELNDSLNRTDVTEENIGEFRDKFDKKIQAVKDFKANYDEAQHEVNPIDINKLKETDPEFNAKRLAYMKFEIYRDELIFSKDRVRDLAVRLDGMSKILTKDGAISSTELKTLLDSDALSGEILSLSMDVQADKEYDVAPRELKYKEERLNALKAYQKALIKFDSLDSNKNPDAVELVHNEMFEAFNSLINANLKTEDNVSQRVLNRRKFDTYWDYLIKSNERTELQKHANMLLDPDLAVKYMEKTGKVLEDMEKNKGKYILKSLNALHEYEVGNEMFEDLVAAGYAFDMKELDDLMQNNIMPSKLYNIKTNKELSAKEAKEAQKIIEGHVKRLKGKHVFATGSGYTTRKKNESDKRTSKGLLREFAAGKKDAPVNISTFINRLLKSKHITTSEKEILEVLKDLDVAEGTVVLTDNAEAPITIEKDGTVKIDIRFSSEDYKNVGTPFEYLATSALLQAHYTKQLKSDKVLKARTEALMKKAREAYVVVHKHETSANIALFKDPVHFLSEALNNKSFQSFLSTVEDVDTADDAKTNSLWESFMKILRDTYGKLFEGTLLNRAVKLSQLALTDEQIEATTEEREEVEEAEEAEKVYDSRRAELEAKVEAVEAKIKEVEKEKGSMRNMLKKRKRLELLNIELRQAKDELARLPKEVQAKDKGKNKSHPVEQTPVEELDADGNVVIGPKTPFKSLPEDLQEELASTYLDRIDHSSVPKKGTPETEVEEDAMTKSQGSFDEVLTEDSLPPDASINQLTAEDIVAIQGDMQTNPKYIDIIGKYNANRLKSQEAGETVEVEVEVKVEVDEEEVEIDETLDTDPTYNKADLEGLVPEINKHYSESEVEIILNELNAGTVTLDELHKGVAERKVEQEGIREVRLQNWRTNAKTLRGLSEGKKFEANNKVMSLSKADVILFKQQHDEAVKLPPAEFQTALAAYALQSRAKAKTLKVAGLGFLNDENLYDNTIALIKDIKDAGLLSSRTISAINRQLRDMKAPYHVKNVSRSKGLAISYAPVNKKVTLERDYTETQDQQLASFFMDEVNDASIGYDSASYLVYQWLQNNKVHPSLPGEKRTYNSKKSKWTSFDGIADNIFQEYSEEAMELIGGATNIVEELLNRYEDMTSFRADLLEIMNAPKEESEEYYEDEASYRAEQVEKELAKYYDSRAFLIASGLFEGNVENLSAEERKLYNSMATAYIDEVITPVEADVLAIQSEITADRTDKSLNTWVKFVINRVNEENVPMQELVAIHRILTKGRVKLTVEQNAKIMNVLHARITEGDFLNKTVVVGTDVLRITENSTTEALEFENVESGEFTIVPVHEALSMIDEVLEDNTEYEKSDIDTTIDKEDSGILKQAYSDVFAKFTESMEEVSETEPEVLKASIIEELNKCK